MERRSYRQGFEDALELLLLDLRMKGIEVSKEVMDEIDYLLSAIKEDKVMIIKRELGIL